MKNIYLGLVVLLLGNCMTIGSVGYIVPDKDESRKPTEIKKAETFDFLSSSAHTDFLNQELKTQKYMDLTNVNLDYSVKGCLTSPEMPEIK